MEVSIVTKKYWEQEDWQALENAGSIGDLHAISLRVLERMPKPIVQVCGPISTGGLGSMEKNLDNFCENIIKLQEQNLNVFDQMPFEGAMQKLKDKLSPGEYLESILTDFYLPIFKSGNVTTFYFLPDWESSHGARWEHKVITNLGIEIYYL